MYLRSWYDVCFFPKVPVTASATVHLNHILAVYNKFWAKVLALCRTHCYSHFGVFICLLFNCNLMIILVHLAFRAGMLCFMDLFSLM